MQVKVNAGNINQLASFVLGYHVHVVENTTRSREKHAYMIERVAKSKVAVDTSRLKSSINTKHKSKKSLIGTNVVYARAREFGSKSYVIKPKKAKFLKFKGKDGNWVFVKKANYPAGKGKKPYLIPAFEEVTPKFESDIERILSSYDK